MLEILLFTINSIMPIIGLIVLGYMLKRVGFFSKEFLKYGNKTVFYVCLPVLLFKNIADIDDLTIIRMDVVAFTIGVIVILTFMGWAAALFVPESRQKGVIHQCIFRSNFALIGVPLSELLGGGNGVRTAAILSLFTIPIFNVLGVIVLSIYKDGNVKVDARKIVRDVYHNPLIRGVLLGLVVAVLKFWLHDTEFYRYIGRISFVGTGVSYIARSATPLALLVLGGQFDFERIAGYKKQLIMGVTGRNIVAPLIGIGIAAVLTKTGVTQFGPDVFAALIALFGTPVAVASAIMAEAMDNDGALAGQLVVWTSLVSMVTLFIDIFVVRALGLI